MLQTESKTTPGYQLTPRVACDPQGVWHVRGYAEAKALLAHDLRQAGFSAERVESSGFDPVLYQHGEAHRLQRAQIARFFSPTTVMQQHAPLMERTATALIEALKQHKRFDLNELSLRMATNVVAAVVGLEPSASLVRNLNTMLHSGDQQGKPTWLRWVPPGIWGQLGTLGLWWQNVRPAIAAHRRAPQNDVISHLLAKGKNDAAILTECIVYGAAGIATTQEFISVAFWHCHQRPELKKLLLTADTEARHALLHEILRLEPVIAEVIRTTPEAVTVTSGGQTHTIPAGARIHMHLYDINVDAQVLADPVGQVQPHRDLPRGISPSLMGFGAGHHRCAGEFLALWETDIFLQKLLAVPNLRVEQPPTVGRNPTVKGYEIRNFILALE